MFTEKEKEVILKMINIAIGMNELQPETLKKVEQLFRDQDDFPQLKNEDFMSRMEVARHLKCSLNFVDKLCRQKKIKKFYFVNRRPMISRTDIMNYISSKVKEA